MANNNLKENFLEEVVVSSFEVVCDGGGKAFGHPRVYLRIEQEKGYVICPYCSRSYVLKA